MIQNIGTLHGPLLIFGGPYSNLEATKAVLDVAKARGIKPGNIICTGDVTAYCGNPQETTDLIRQSGIHVIQGNCEESLASDNSDCGCGYDTGSQCAKLSELWYEHAKIQTSADNKKWMGNLPKRLTFTYAGRRVHVLHGSPASISEFVFPSTSKTTKEAMIESLDTDIVLCGHSGFPFTDMMSNKVWHNAGVVGLPANDGTPRTWYSIIEATAEALTFSHSALSYDLEKAASIMKHWGLDHYAATIEDGIYPTFDSIPNHEKSVTGKALKEYEVMVSLQASGLLI